MQPNRKLAHVSGSDLQGWQDTSEVGLDSFACLCYLCPMTNTEVIVTTPAESIAASASEATQAPVRERKTISVSLPPINARLAALIAAVVLITAALTSAAFLLWGPHNPIPEGMGAYKVPAGTLTVSRETGVGQFQAYTTPQYLYSTLTPRATWDCLKAKGYSDFPAAFGMNATIMVADSTDYFLCN